VEDWERRGRWKKYWEAELGERPGSGRKLQTLAVDLSGTCMQCRHRSYAV